MLRALLGAMVETRLARFVIAGAASAGLFLVTCYAPVIGGMSPLFGSLLSYALAFSAGYTLQRSWTFQGQHRHASALPRYFVLQVGCALASGVIAQTSTVVFRLSPFLMSLVTTAAAGLLSYLLSSNWVFRDEEAE